MPPGDALGEERLRELIDVGRSLVREHSVESVLENVLDRARELTGARYAALGVLDQRRERLERFLTRGIDELTHTAIGDLPRGRGILRLLIDEPEPLRLDDVSRHPRSYGFPVNHPPMSTFLGVPVVIRGEAWGNLYLTEKEGGQPFTAADEDAAVILADWTAIAIENARLYQRMEARRDELERAVRGMEATAAIAQALGAETRLDRVLELIVKRGRALVDARALVILLVDGEGLVVAAQAGELPPGLSGLRLPTEGTLPGDVLRRGSAERVSDLSARVRGAADSLGLGATAALFVPLLYRGNSVGVLAAYDRLGDAPEFKADDEWLLRSFAASAAIAVATATSVQSEQLRRSLDAAERERGRWARELHDEVLQTLAGLRMRLASADRRGELETLRPVVTEAVEQLDGEIREIRRLIAELRPAALDDFGLGAALASLIERAAPDGAEVDVRIELGDAQEGGEARFAPEVETAVYRLVQEALANVAKHAQASRLSAEVVRDGDAIRVTVVDDGSGFDPQQETHGYGLAGMRERATLLGGELTITSSARGTRVEAHVPAHGTGDASRAAGAAAHP